MPHSTWSVAHRGVAWSFLAILSYVALSTIVATVAGPISAAAAGSAAPFVRLLVTALGVSGMVLTLIVPGAAMIAALSQGPWPAARFFPAAFVVSLGIGVAPMVLFATFRESSRAWFTWLAVVLVVAGVIETLRATSRTFRVTGARAIGCAALLFMVVVPAWMWGKIFVEDLSGDGLEAFEFTRSLAAHALPHWDLENGFVGFHPTFMLFTYPARLCMMVLGEVEAAVRLPVVLYGAGSFLLLADLVRAGRREARWSEIAVLTGAFMLFFATHAFHSTYELFADLAEPLGTDLLAVFLALSAAHSLVHGRAAWFAVYGTLASMATPAGLPVVALIYLGWLLKRKSGRSFTAALRPGMALAAGLATWGCVVWVHGQVHPMGITRWSAANFLSHYPPGVDLDATIGITSRFLVYAGVIPIVGVLLMSWRDPVSRVLLVPTVGYLLLLIVFGRAHPHYLIPIVLLPTALLLRSTQRQSERRTAGTILRLATLVSCVGLSAAAGLRPPPPHTAYRRFAATTTVPFNDPLTANAAAQAVLDAIPGVYIHLPMGLPVFGEARPVQFANDGPISQWIRSESELADLVRDRAELSGGVPPGLLGAIWIRYAASGVDQPNPARRSSSAR